MAKKKAVQKKGAKKAATKVVQKATRKAQTRATRKPAPRRAAAKPGAKRAAAKPTTPKLHIHSVVHQVGDLERASSGYAQLLADVGRRIEQGGGRHYFDLGDAVLSILDVSQGGVQPQPGGSDLYLSVPSLDPYHERASQLGWLSNEEVHGSPAAEMAMRPWGERSFYIEDPWGNGICFVEAGTEFTGKQ
jgi:hypothetical protein